MFSVTLLLVTAAFIVTILAGLGRAQLWIAVLLLTITVFLMTTPGLR